MAQKGGTKTGKDKGERERYEYRIPIRMTREERVLIGRSACKLDMSVSRYLVQNATTTRPLKAEDGARLRYLQDLFAQASHSVEALLSLPAVRTGEGANAASQIGETARLLRCLAAEIGRRLS